MSSVELPLISIITPSYNQGQFLEQTIQSVLAQDYPNLEYIIIDGGSTDDSVQVIKKYADQLTYWVSEKDKGQTDAINKGLGLCQGEYVNWLNSDDCLTPGALLAIAEGFAQSPDADFVYGDTEVILKDGAVLQARPETSFHPLILRYGANLFSQPACFFRRRTGEKLGWLDPSLHWSMDYDFWLRAAASGAAFKQIKKLVARFRLHDFSKSGSNHAKIRVEHYECYRRHTGNVLLRPKALYRALKGYYRLFRVLRLYFERGVWQPGEYGRALRHLSKVR